jgi:hypothetical protein
MICLKVGSRKWEKWMIANYGEYGNTAIKMYKLKWTDEDYNNISDEYTGGRSNYKDGTPDMVHIALEKADMNNDRNSFDYILKKDPITLKKHMQGNDAVFHCNFM